MKKYLDSLYSAINSILAYKMRSFLTMLGIIIGIAAVILITSLGDAVYNTIYEEMSAFNMTSIMVMTRNFVSSIDSEDTLAISELPNVYAVASNVGVGNLYMNLRNGSYVRRGTIVGLDHNYLLVENVNMLYGRFFSEADVINSSYVAVITSSTSLDVFGTTNSVGMNLDIEGRFGRFSPVVIGVVDFDENTLANIGTPWGNAMATMPSTTLANRRGNPGIFDEVIVFLENDALSLATSDQIARLLNLRHGTEDAFLTLSLTTIVDGIDAVFLAITAFITFVAGISLFVGGVGVMNIMMVTVTERTREIGIRKSLGASGLIIRIQFVFESILITSIGGVIGIILGFLSSYLVTYVVRAASPLDIYVTISYMPIVIAVTTSILIGVVFGVYPAGKAAKLDPVESLRYE